jgi:outer membrane receptor protein involved in Fe transport
MRHRLLCLAFALIAPVTALAQTTGILSGKVVDDEGKPMIGATIRLEGTSIGGLSKAPDGRFTIAGVRAGDYTVIVGGIGVQPVRKNVRVSIGQTTDMGQVKLTSAAVGVKEIVVRDTRVIERERVTTTREVSRETMERSARTSIIDAVALQGGVNTRGQNGIAIRGGRSTETSIRVDGVEVTDPFTGGFGSTAASIYPTVSTLAVQEVQVMPNAVSAEFGDAISGVVNSVTRSGRNDRYEGAFRIRTPIAALYGSSDDMTVTIAGSDRDTTLAGVKKSSSQSTLYEFGFGGPFPGFNDLTFYLTGKVNPIKHASAGYEVFDMSPEFAARRAALADQLWGYHLEPTNLGQLDDTEAMVRDFNAKLKLTLSPEIFLELGGEYGLTTRELGGWGNLYLRDHPAVIVRTPSGGLDTAATYARDPVTGRFDYTKPLAVDNTRLESEMQSPDQNTIINRYFARYFQSLDQATYFEINAQYFHNLYEAGKKIEREYSFLEPYEIQGPLDKDNNKIIDQYEDPSVQTVLNQYLPSTARSQIRLRNLETGLYEGGEATGASRNPFGLIDLNFPTHGNDRTLEIRESSTLTFKGMYETNFDLGEVGTQVKAGFDVNTYTLSRHENNLPWVANPFFDVYGFDAPYFDTAGAEVAMREFLADPYTPLDGALWVQTRFDYKSILFQPGVRFDFISPNAQVSPAKRSTYAQVVESIRSGEDASLKFQVSPRIGVSYPVTDQSQFRVSFAMMFKMPDFNRMFDNAYGSSARGNQIFGNPDIDPQKVFNYEIGYQAQFAEMYFLDVVAFYRDVYNQVGISFIPAVPSPFLLYTVQEYGNVRGLEVSLSRDLADNVAANVNYTLQRAVGTASSPEANYGTLIGGTDPYTGESRTVPLAEYPLSYDQTHKINASLSLVWGNDEGPTIGGLNLLENTTLTITGTFNSGLPYTRLNTRGEQEGEFFAERQPSFYTTEAHLERGFRLADILGEGAGNLEISLFADVFNLLNTTQAVGVYATSGSPTTNNTSFNRQLGDFVATPFFRDVQAARPETYSQAQYDRFGQRYYNPYADLNLDGVVTQLEKYEGYRRFITTIQNSTVRGNFQDPRSVFVGVRVKF